MRVTAVMLAYGAEPYLGEAARAILASTGADVELIVVDNGCTSVDLDIVKGLPGARVLTPAENTGYAGGCRLGAAEATGDVLAFVNSDAIVAPDALAHLATAVGPPGVGGAMASVRLASDPDLINTAGNPLHFMGLSWAGGNGRPAGDYAVRRHVPSLSGCCFAIRRELWVELDGFAAEYFAYHEDTELSLRLWQRGLTAEYIPDAVAVHHYEFSRNDLKQYLVERNRLITMLTAYQGRTLAVLAPMIVVTELALFAASLMGGWSRPKARGWAWLWRNRRWLRSRRALLQRERTVPDAELAHLMTATVDPSNVAAPPGIGAYNAVARLYWRAARPLLPRRVSGR